MTMSMPSKEDIHQDYGDDYDDKMLRIGDDYALYETVDKNHHYEDVYNYVVDRYFMFSHLNKDNQKRFT